MFLFVPALSSTLFTEHTHKPYINLNQKGTVWNFIFSSKSSTLRQGSSFHHLAEKEDLDSLSPTDKKKKRLQLNNLWILSISVVTSTDILWKDPSLHFRYNTLLWIPDSPTEGRWVKVITDNSMKTFQTFLSWEPFLRISTNFYLSIFGLQYLLLKWEKKKSCLWIDLHK